MKSFTFWLNQRKQWVQEGNPKTKETLQIKVIYKFIKKIRNFWPWTKVYHRYFKKLYTLGKYGIKT